MAFRFLIICSIALVSHLTFASDKGVSNEEGAQMIAQYLGNFKTFGEVISNFKAIGILTADDKTEILTFLNERGIKPDTKIKTAKTKGTALSWGHVGWKPAAGTDHVTLSGAIVKWEKNEGGAKSFKRMFSALNRNSASNWQGIFFDHANAQSMETNAETASGSLGYTLKNWGITIGLNIGLTAWGSLGYITGFVEKYFVAPILDGSQGVECLEGTYAISKRYSTEVSTEFEKVSKDCADPKSLARSMISFESLCKYIAAGLSYEEENMEGAVQGNRTNFVSNRTLESVFNENPPPKCNKENLAKVNAALRQKILEIVFSDDTYSYQLNRRVDVQKTKVQN